ncbi:hypothetical protein OEZ85_001783 [Tetradesmus obliquus]|uniref:RWP-RK domain-containing protein n=1 Tax=Tetradesmus obliquus TaxID=3088 RepID=A0ABY8U1G5_TETOB|nr:hypothetical protein OEZ85_001783 [Tetradesmus obliquus]
MLQENPAALGEPITAEHKAHVATVTWRRGSSICGPMGPAAAAARGGICMDDDEGVLRYEQVEQLFGQLNVAEAAAHLGMGKTKFKALCRQFGIVRWPYREFCSIFLAQKEFCSIFLAQEYLDAKAAKGRARDGALMPGRRLLLVHALTLLQQHPNMELKAHPAYVLTQVLHKQKHKKRKVEERHADESAAAVLTHIHAAASSGGDANGSDGSGSA